MSTRFPSSDGWSIDDYRVGRARALKRTKEVRRQRAYFLKGSLAYDHCTLRLGAEQSWIIELRKKCLGALQVAIMQHALQYEPSSSDISMQAHEAAAPGRAA